MRNQSINQSFVRINLCSRSPTPIGSISLHKYKTKSEIRIRSLDKVVWHSKRNDDSDESSTQNFVLISKLAGEFRRLQLSPIIGLIRRSTESNTGE
jgi:hypothetical protein